MAVPLWLWWILPTSFVLPLVASFASFLMYCFIDGEPRKTERYFTWAKRLLILGVIMLSITVLLFATMADELSRTDHRFLKALADLFL